MLQNFGYRGDQLKCTNISYRIQLCSTGHAIYLAVFRKWKLEIRFEYERKNKVRRVPSKRSVALILIQIMNWQNIAFSFYVLRTLVLSLWSAQINNFRNQLLTFEFVRSTRNNTVTHIYCFTFGIRAVLRFKMSTF